MATLEPGWGATASVAVVALTEAALRERQSDVAETLLAGVDCLAGIEIRPLSAAASDTDNAAAGTPGASVKMRHTANVALESAFQRAWLARTQGRFADVNTILTAAIHRFPMDFRFRFNRGYIRLKMAQYEEAVQDFCTVLHHLGPHPAMERIIEQSNPPDPTSPWDASPRSSPRSQHTPAPPASGHAVKTSSRPVTGGRATTRRRGSLKPPTESALNDVLHVRLRDFSVRAPTTTGLLSGAGTAESEESSAAASLRRHDGSFYLPEDERELESATTKPSTAAERLSRRKGEDTAAAKAVRMARIVACYNAAVACIKLVVQQQRAEDVRQLVARIRIKPRRNNELPPAGTPGAVAAATAARLPAFVCMDPVVYINAALALVQHFERHKVAVLLYARAIAHRVKGAFLESVHDYVASREQAMHALRSASGEPPSPNHWIAGTDAVLPVSVTDSSDEVESREARAPLPDDATSHEPGVVPLVAAGTVGGEVAPGPPMPERGVSALSTAGSLSTAVPPPSAARVTHFDDAELGAAAKATFTSLCHNPALAILRANATEYAEANGEVSVQRVYALPWRLPSDVPEDMTNAAGFLDCYYGDGPLFKPAVFCPSETAMSASMLRQKCASLVPAADAGTTTTAAERASAEDGNVRAGGGAEERGAPAHSGRCGRTPPCAHPESISVVESIPAPGSAISSVHGGATLYNSNRANSTSAGSARAGTASCSVPLEQEIYDSILADLNARRQPRRRSSHARTLSDLQPDSAAPVSAASGTISVPSAQESSCSNNRDGNGASSATRRPSFSAAAAAPTTGTALVQARSALADDMTDEDFERLTPEFIALLAEKYDHAVLQNSTTRGQLISSDRIAFVMYVTRDSRLLASLPSYAHAAIAHAMTVKNVPRGTIIYKQGDAANEYFVIVDGSVRVHLDRQHSAKKAQKRVFSAVRAARKWIAMTRTRRAEGDAERQETARELERMNELASAYMAAGAPMHTVKELLEEEGTVNFDISRLSPRNVDSVAATPARPTVDAMTTVDAASGASMVRGRSRGNSATGEAAAPTPAPAVPAPAAPAPTAPAPISPPPSAPLRSARRGSRPSTATGAEDSLAPAASTPAVSFHPSVVGGSSWPTTSDASVPRPPPRATPSPVPSPTASPHVRSMLKPRASFRQKAAQALERQLLDKESESSRAWAAGWQGEGMRMIRALPGVMLSPTYVTQHVHAATVAAEAEAAESAKADEPVVMRTDADVEARLSALPKELSYAERAIQLQAGSPAPVSHFEAELLLGTVLGTLHVGESFGERAITGAWAAVTSNACVRQLPHVDLFSLPKPLDVVGEDESSWREVTAVAAEDCCLLCLNKQDFVRIMNQLHDTIDAVVAAFLSRVPMFSCCTRAELAALAQHALQRRYVSGQVLVAQGQRLEGCYIMRSGRVVVETQQVTETITQVTSSPMPSCATGAAGPFKRASLKMDASPIHSRPLSVRSGGSPRHSTDKRISDLSARTPPYRGSSLPRRTVRAATVTVSMRRNSLIEQEHARNYLASFGVNVNRKFSALSRFAERRAAALADAEKDATSGSAGGDTFEHTLRADQETGADGARASVRSSGELRTPGSARPRSVRIGVPSVNEANLGSVTRAAAITLPSARASVQSMAAGPRTLTFAPEVHTGAQMSSVSIRPASPTGKVSVCAYDEAARPSLRLPLAAMPEDAATGAGGADADDDMATADGTSAPGLRRPGSLSHEMMNKLHLPLSQLTKGDSRAAASSRRGVDASDEHASAQRKTTSAASSSTARGFAAATSAEESNMLAARLIMGRRRLSATTEGVFRRMSMDGAIQRDVGHELARSAAAAPLTARNAGGLQSVRGSARITFTRESRKLTLGHLSLYDMFGEAQILSVPQTATTEPLPKAGSTGSAHVASSGNHAAWAENIGLGAEEETVRYRAVPVRINSPATVVCESHVEVLIITRDTLFKCTSFLSRQRMREYCIGVATKAAARSAAAASGAGSGSGGSGAAASGGDAGSGGGGSAAEAALSGAGSALSGGVATAEQQVEWERYRQRLADEMLLSSERVRALSASARGDVISYRGRAIRLPSAPSQGIRPGTLPSSVGMRMH